MLNFFPQWTLDIRYPQPFSSLLGLLGIFSMDFLALECFQGSGVAPDERYFATVLLYSIIPILLASLVAVAGVARAFIARSILLRAKQHTSSSSSAGDVSAAVGRIANQHVFLLLLLSYLVLPPVASKQFQALDCIPLSHSGASVLRSDTAIDCHGADYQNFRAAVIFLIFAYQSVPVLWLALLFRRRSMLNPSMNNRDARLALYMRDHNSSLDTIRFLFHDYKCSKWWFEIVEMYRRIVICGVVPLCSTVNATRASLGVVLAIASLMYFREEAPYRMRFVNAIANVAQGQSTHRSTESLIS